MRGRMACVTKYFLFVIVPVDRYSIVCNWQQKFGIIVRKLELDKTKQKKLQTDGELPDLMSSLSSLELINLIREMLSADVMLRPTANEIVRVVKEERERYGP